jgi:hypothetical protein
LTPGLGDALEAFILEHEYCGGELDAAVEADRVWMTCTCGAVIVQAWRRPAMTDRRGRLLLVTLEAARVNAELPVLTVLRSWLDSWRGIGAVERGMAHQGFDLQLTRYDERGWRATFYRTGMEHSPTSATGSAWEPTPWRAVRARLGMR